MGQPLDDGGPVDAGQDAYPDVLLPSVEGVLAPEVVDPGPMEYGLSQASGPVAALATELGVGWVRQTFGWRFLDEVVEGEPLDIEQAMSDEMLETYSRARDFSSLDATIERFRAAELEIMVGVGSGWRRALPRLESGGVAGPTEIGPDNYIAHQVLVTRAIVERFDGDGYLDAPGSPIIRYWQVENELNEALTTAIGGSRSPTGVDAVGSDWASGAFIDRLLFALIEAVREAFPEAQIGTNLHASVHPNINRTLGVTNWQQTLRRWRARLDWVGLDLYPNYLISEPTFGSRVGDAVLEARSLSAGFPVFVIETGYSSGPDETGFSESLQEEYLRDAAQSAQTAGARAFFWYGTRTSEAHDVEISERDVAAIRALGEANDRGDAGELLALIAEDREYYEGHLLRVVDATARYAGLLRADGTPKPAHATLRELAAD